MRSRARGQHQVSASCGTSSSVGNKPSLRVAAPATASDKRAEAFLWNLRFRPPPLCLLASRNASFCPQPQQHRAVRWIFPRIAPILSYCDRAGNVRVFRRGNQFYYQRSHHHQRNRDDDERQQVRFGVRRVRWSSVMLPCVYFNAEQTPCCGRILKGNSGVVGGQRPGGKKQMLIRWSQLSKVGKIHKNWKFLHIIFQELRIE